MLPARAGPGTPESLRRIWEDPRPFRGRYHVLAAMGELGRPESVAPLREGLAPQRSLDERAHAAQGLGAFAADPRVREALIAVVAGDPEPAVRGAAIRSLAKAPAPDAVAALDRLRTLPWQDPETRRLLDLVRASVAPR
jgi:HEAT repeat protein